MSRYVVLSGQGNGAPEQRDSVNTLREARSIAYRRARQVRHYGHRPVWVDGSRSWNSASAVGGYDPDCGETHAYAVVHRAELLARKESDDRAEEMLK